MGFRTKIVGDLNLFGEALAQPVIERKGYENDFREDGSFRGVIMRNTTRSGDGAYAAGAGVSLGLSDAWTLFGGARYESAHVQVFTSAADNLSRGIKSTRATTWNAATGITWRRGNLLWQLGASYRHQRAVIGQKNSFANGTTDISSAFDLTVTSDAFGVYSGLSFDF